MGEEQALDRLRDILARPEYQVDQSRPWWDQLLGPLWEVVSYFLARLVQTVADATDGREGWYGIGVLAVCSVLIVSVGVYLIRAVRLSVAADARTGSGSLAERRERSERLWQTAQQLAGTGQWSEAVRVVYLSALYALDERALLHVQTSLTNREHARQLSRSNPTVARTFSEVVDQYDRVRYGRLPVTRATFAELSSLVSQARSASLHRSTP